MRRFLFITISISDNSLVSYKFLDLSNSLIVDQRFAGGFFRSVFLSLLAGLFLCWSVFLVPFYSLTSIGSEENVAVAIMFAVCKPEVEVVVVVPMFIKRTPLLSMLFSSALVDLGENVNIFVEPSITGCALFPLAEAAATVCLAIFYAALPADYYMLVALVLLTKWLPASSKFSPAALSA